MQSQLLPPPLKVVGHISGKHGFQGNIQVQYLPGFSKAQIKKGNYLFVVINGKGVPFSVLDISKLGDIISLQFISDEKSAKNLIGCEIAIPADVLTTKSNRKTTSPQSLSDIVGWNVVETNLGSIGTVTEIQELPQGFILVVSTELENFLIPLVEHWIVDFQAADRTITMQLPEGLLAINQK